MKQVIFIHTPRTGGTTISTLMYSLFYAFEIYDCRNRAKTQAIAAHQFLDLEDRYKFKCVLGHMNIDVLNEIDYPYIAFSVFRNPVDRIKSLYAHIKLNPNHHLHENAGKGLEWLLKSETYPEFYSGMVHRFSGIDFSPGFYSDVIVELAFEYIKNKLIFVGFFDKMELVYDWVEKELMPLASWDIKKLTTLPKLNKGAPVDITKKELKLIEHYNKMDLELWEKLREYYL